MDVDFSQLNLPQHAAVFHCQGPLLVLAGAGSGKTRVMMYRIARLLTEQVPPSRIIGLTFTNKAALQMRQRLRDLVGEVAIAVELLTFHALSLRILEENGEAIGLLPGFCIYDTSDQLSLVRELLRHQPTQDRRLDCKRLLQLILQAKKARQSEIPDSAVCEYQATAHLLYPLYRQQMQAFHAVDFDDLLLKAQDALQVDYVRQRWQHRYGHILVDEYQDTSSDQLELIKTLAGEVQQVCAVGDDDQAIYAFRGANQDAMSAFKFFFPATQVILLEQNYRSTGAILAVANRIIAPAQGQHRKILWSAASMGDMVDIVTCADDDDEALFVVERILSAQLQGYALADMAILYRTNTQARFFEEQLRAHNLAYRVVGGQAFFDRKEVRDALAFLTVVHNSAQELALRRIINVPPRGIGPQSLEYLTTYAKQWGLSLWQALVQAEQVPHLSTAALKGATALVAMLAPWQEQFARLQGEQALRAAEQLFAALNLQETVLEAHDPPHVIRRRLANLEEVGQAFARFVARNPQQQRPLGAFLRATQLYFENRSQDSQLSDSKNEQDQITLMTLHAAKGLEFALVFLVGVEEDNLPHKRALEMLASKKITLDEERRLCYVGCTRARERLWLTHASQRRSHKKLIPRTPSRFLASLNGLTHITRHSRASATVTAAKQADQAAALFFQTMQSRLANPSENSNKC